MKTYPFREKTSTLQQEYPSKQGYFKDFPGVLHSPFLASWRGLGQLDFGPIWLTLNRMGPNPTYSTRGAGADLTTFENRSFRHLKVVQKWIFSFLANVQVILCNFCFHGHVEKITFWTTFVQGLAITRIWRIVPATLEYIARAMCQIHYRPNVAHCAIFVKAICMDYSVLRQKSELVFACTQRFMQRLWSHMNLLGL